MFTTPKEKKSEITDKSAAIQSLLLCKNDDDFIAKLNKIDIYLLCELSLESDALYQELIQERWCKHWVYQLELLNQKPNPLIPEFQQLRAAIFYLKALETSDYDTKMKLLNFAANTGSFDAARTVLMLRIPKLKTLNLQEMEKSIFQLSDLYLAPGHLLIAEYFLNIAMQYNKPGDNANRYGRYLLALTHLHYAIELWQTSSACVANAYRDKDISAAYQEKLLFPTLRKIIPEITDLSQLTGLLIKATQLTKNTRFLDDYKRIVQSVQEKTKLKVNYSSLLSQAHR